MALLGRYNTGRLSSCRSRLHDDRYAGQLVIGKRHGIDAHVRHLPTRGYPMGNDTTLGAAMEFKRPGCGFIRKLPTADQGRVQMPPNAIVALLLEDEPLIALDLEMTLGNAGFDVTTVTSCSEALEWLDVCRPDIVIVDIILSDGPCHAVVKQLVADGIPFLVHSGDHPSMHADTPFAGGKWVSKPADVGEMARAARELIAA